jgi:DNA-directed RNA polymerase subunit beta'
MSDTGLPLVSDPNYLYKELIEANNNLRDMGQEVDDVGDERLAVYHALKAVTGLGDPVHPKLVTKNIQGVLKKVFGSSPKFGTVQRKLLAQNVDLVGRAVIIPDPDLDMDHAGVPEEKAWELYRNFIVRRLKRRGLPVTDALKHVENRTQLARTEMLDEMENRPIIATRAPVLHRFGVQAFRPRIVKGDALRVSPLIVKGFGADFDGDTMNYHVPVSEEARVEALERMLPSRNLFSPADFKSPVHAPSQEYTGGLYAASTMTGDDKPPRVFRNAQDAVQAWRRGEISVNTNVVIME